jgi:hypothetical protein
MKEQNCDGVCAAAVVGLFAHGQSVHCSRCWISSAIENVQMTTMQIISFYYYSIYFIFPFIYLEVLLFRFASLPPCLQRFQETSTSIL